MNVKCFDLGVCMTEDKTAVSCCSVGGNRGRVQCFSCSSRRRMRKWLLTKYIPSCFPYGVTLTIPRCDFDLDLLSSRFRECFHRFRTYFLRLYPSHGFVWRIELQCSGMPHFHLVVYSDCLTSDSVFRLWFDSVRGLFPIPSFSDFVRRGVRVDLLDGDIRAYRYLCDHGTKHKESQLGWIGRQWGVVGRRNFVDKSYSCYDLHGKSLYRFRRFLARLCSRSIPSKCVFGSRLIRRKSFFSVMYCKSSTVARWMQYHKLKSF